MTDDSRMGLPDRFGHFRVVEELGQGGMGTVYVGVDDTLQRRVALKVIRAEHRLDPDRKARLLREARILSQLDHPGICQLHDYIEGEDADCLVLELVDGASLRQAMDDAALDHGRKLAVVGQLLDVLVAVHGRGIIHRDLTPHNVMLTPSFEVKVLDFGLARIVPTEASEEQLSAETERRPFPVVDEAGTLPGGPSHSNVAADRMTAHGTVVGTAGYMSPEQARGEPATAASDMYSLGLILQELLTGRSPYAENLDARELRRRAMWAETEPVTGVQADLTELIGRLTSLVSASRPSSVDAAEMLRLVVDRPRRRRRRVLIAAVWLALAAFGAGMTVEYLRAEREAERAERQATRAEEEEAAAHQVSEFLVGLFQVSDPGKGEDAEVTARELLDSGAARIERELAEQPVVRARMVHTMGVVYHHLGDLERAQEMLATALDTRQEELGPDHPDVAETLHEAGLVHRYLGQYDEARDVVERGLRIVEAAFGPDSVESARFHEQLANLENHLGRHEAAEARYHRVLSIYERDPEVHAEGISSALGGLADLYLLLGRFADAEPLLLRAIELDGTTHGTDSLEEASHLAKLGHALIRTKRPAEAEQLYLRALAIREEALGPDSPLVAGSLVQLASCLRAAGRETEAAQHEARAEEIRSKGVER